LRVIRCPTLQVSQFLFPGQRSDTFLTDHVCNFLNVYMQWRFSGQYSEGGVRIHLFGDSFCLLHLQMAARFTAQITNRMLRFIRSFS